MKRVSFILVSLVILVSCILCFSAPVSAANNVVSPTDFNFSVEPIANSEYKINLPTTHTQYWERYLSGDVRYTNTGASWTGQSSTERLLDNIYYKIYPFGLDNFLDLSSAIDLLPSHIILTFTSISSHQTSFDIVLEVGYDILTSSGINSYSYASVTQHANNLAVPNILNINERPPIFNDGGLDPMRIWYKLSFANLSSQTSENLYTFNIITMSSFAFTTDAVHGAYFLDVYNQNVTNGKFDDMIGEQEDTNNKLDEIINSTPEPAPPEGSDDVNDVIDQEDALLNDSIANYEDNEHFFDFGISSIRTYLASLDIITRLLNGFLGIRFFQHLTWISLSLGVLAVILNIGQSVIKSADASARSKKSKD